jgi:hypothetical protein
MIFFIFRYKDYIIIRPHPAPKKFENFELTGKIYCKHCHWEWGVMGVYKKVPFPIIKISSFVIDIDRQATTAVQEMERSSIHSFTLGHPVILRKC